MKKERNLKVYSSSQTNHSSYNHTLYTEVPMILLKGKWLEEAGFHPSDNITLSIKDNQIIITNKGNDNI